MTILLVGLGNPGPTYKNTRHNVGFSFIDALIDRYNLPNLTEKSGFSFVNFSEEGKKIMLMKPLKYMNLSGGPVGNVVNFYKIDPNDILVFHDDLDLNVGNLKARFSGSARGHKGIKSIMQHVSADFWRIHIGIDRPANKDLVSDYVLEKPNLQDQNKITDCLNFLVDNASHLYNKNFDFFKLKN